MFAVCVPHGILKSSTTAPDHEAAACQQMAAAEIVLTINASTGLSISSSAVYIKQMISHGVDHECAYTHMRF